MCSSGLDRSPIMDTRYIDKRMVIAVSVHTSRCENSSLNILDAQHCYAIVDLGYKFFKVDRAAKSWDL
jgi:hypothetical protein